MRQATAPPPSSSTPMSAPEAREAFCAPTGTWHSAFARQPACHYCDRALIDLSLVPFLQDHVIGRARLPALARLPAVAGQEIGGGGEHVRNAVLKIPASVAVEIDRILEVARREE